MQSLCCDDGVGYTEKELPQPQPDWALGLSMMN